MSKQRQLSSTTYHIAFLMVDSADHITGKTGLTVTLTASKNATAFGAVSGAVTEIANGWYKWAANATDRDTLGSLALHATATGADPTDDLYEIVTVDPFAAVTVTTMSDKTGYALTSAYDPAKTASQAGDVMKVSSGTGANQVSLSSGAVLLQATQTGVTIPTVTTLTNAPPDSSGVTTLLARIGAFTGSGVNTILGFFKALLSKTASTPSDVGGTFDPTTDSTEALADNAGGGSLTAAGVRSAVGLASANLDTQLTALQSDTDDIQTRLPAVLVGGRMDSSTGAMASGVLTATAIASNAITAAKVATDAIGAAQVAADAVTEIQTGLSTLNAAGVRTAVGLASANLDTQLSSVQSDVTSIKGHPDRTVIRGTVSATAPTTTSFTCSALSPAGVAADQFKGRILVFDNATTTTALRGQATDITASSAAGLPLLTFTALTTAPVATDSFSIV